MDFSHIQSIDWFFLGFSALVTLTGTAIGFYYLASCLMS